MRLSLVCCQLLGWMIKTQNCVCKEEFSHWNTSNLLHWKLAGTVIFTFQPNCLKSATLLVSLDSAALCVVIVTSKFFNLKFYYFRIYLILDTLFLVMDHWSIIVSDTDYLPLFSKMPPKKPEMPGIGEIFTK